MTKLNKPVKRESNVPADWRGNPIIVIIEPNGTIGFREKKRRKTFWLPIRDCYEWAVRAEVNAELKRKKAEKRVRRAARRR